MKKMKLLVLLLFFPLFFSGCASSDQKNKSLNLSVSSLNNSQKKDLFAHRGFWGQYPENSMEAFQNAYDNGFFGIELDVRFSKDEVPVVFHDMKLKRMSGVKGVLSSFTFDELKKIRIGNKKQLRNEQPVFIPSFEDYCMWVSEKKEITTIIELKSDKDWIEGHEQKLINLIEKYEISDRVIFASFDSVPLVLIKKNRPEMKCSIISDDKKCDVAEIAKSNGFDCVSVQWKLAKEKLVKECHQNNILVNLWTADSFEEADSFFEKGADFVTGNF